MDVSATEKCGCAGAVMGDKLLDMVAFKKLEKMPTKTEIFTTLARLLKQVSTVFPPAICVELRL